MPTACCVIGCKSRGNGQAGVQFFQLPLNKPKILTQWLIVLDRRDWVPKPSSKICSLHFSSDDYVVRPNTNVPRLKPDAIPSVFPDLSSSQDERETSPFNKSKEETIPNKTKEETNGFKEDKIKPKEAFSKMMTPIVSESPSGRPRRISKLNSKMKDYILLDDIKKHRNNSFQSPSSRPQPPSDKEKAAQELLSILEDSSSLSGDESRGKFTPNDGAKEKTHKPTSLPSSSSTPKLTSLNLSSKATKTPFSISKLSFEDDVALPKIVPTSRKVASKSTGGKLIKNVKGKEAIRAKGMVREGKLSSSQESLNSNSPKNEKSRSVTKPKVMNKNDTPGFVRKGSPESNVPKKVLPLAFRKTYFQVNEGDKSYYFSYADLNPFVDMTKNNVLFDKNAHLDKNNPSATDDEVTNGENYSIDIKINDDDDIDPLDEMVDDMEDPIDGNDTVEDADVLSCVNEASIVESPPNTVKRAYRKKQQGKKGQKEPASVKLTSRKELRQGMTNKLLKDINENSSANVTTGDLADLAVDETAVSDVTVDEDSVKALLENIPSKVEKGIISPTMSKVSKNFKVTSPVKRKKRFKTVAEIVVRTDNTGQVPSVSIDKINSLVDIESETPPRKRTKRGKTNFISSGSTDLISNEPVMTKISEETELDRLSQRITETIKKMKLLEKVEGNTSKLTVLITTLPPVQEKEILIIKKKNLETNIEQSRELQVAISNYKSSDGNMSGGGYVLSPNSNASLPPFVHLDVPILGACNNDTIIEESVTCMVNDEGNSSSEKGILQKDESQKNPGSKKGSEEVSPLTVEVSSQNPSSESGKDNEAIACITLGEHIPDKAERKCSEGVTGDNGAKGASTEVTVPLQHDHTYMTLPISPAIVLTEGDSSAGTDQSKDVFSKLKLSEVEISFRTKVSQKIRNLKENVKRKNETIIKLRDKIKYLERAMKEEMRIRTKRVVKPRKGVIETTTLYDNVIDSNTLPKFIDYPLARSELPLEAEENAESDEEERACSSPITYLCEPAIDICEKQPPDE